MARIAEVELERLKVEVSVEQLVRAQGRGAGEVGPRLARSLSVP
ncbi:hypothetical protein QCE49_20040 [Caballeronia sp. LZ008]|nr:MULTISPECIES: hypothetical protein [unclassified Caballeronia]MDR5795669.1 hypothetical protein [Caballeronia sp. LZ008]